MSGVKIGRTFTGHAKAGDGLIKTLLIKIVHNKNHKNLLTVAMEDSCAGFSVSLAFKRPFILLLTHQASFLQYKPVATVWKKCRNTGLQSDHQVVYNQPIAVTPPSLFTARPPHD
ncbi:hypothetical protein [Pseudomonas sp. SR18]|uniref:hypothetical protein n=1 Tax=Pseudomonas sp. SR18 TaxID=1461074 RepID=UPI002033BB9B|nr:hypothetical protein [Pseudomonas sp. SR18]MCM2360586.1 hypothetical protein [Pseudomonas sp. SR18]